MADMKEIKELIQLMKRQKVRRLALREKGRDIELELEPLHVEPLHHTPVAVAAPAQSASAPEPETGTFIRSPLVGTFYAASAPGEASFVKVGDTVTPDTVVCIVEAMKVMNEVRAGVSGTVKAVCVSDASPVEFDTKLFEVV